MCRSTGRCRRTGSGMVSQRARARRVLPTLRSPPFERFQQSRRTEATARRPAAASENGHRGAGGAAGVADDWHLPMPCAACCNPPTSREVFGLASVAMGGAMVLAAAPRVHEVMPPTVSVAAQGYNDNYLVIWNCLPNDPVVVGTSWARCRVPRTIVANSRKATCCRSLMTRPASVDKVRATRANQPTRVIVILGEATIH
jgi:hypothetical protein